MSGLSQRKLGELIGVNRGNISSYESGANAPDEVKKALAAHFNLDLSKLLTIEINDSNFSSFKMTNSASMSAVDQNPNHYKKTDIIDLLISAIDEPVNEARESMIKQAIKLYGRVLEENGILKAEVNQLQKDLLEVARRA